VVLLLWPVLAASVNADDRYWFLTVPARAEGSYAELFRWTWETIPTDAQVGRLTPLAFLARRVLALAVTETSIATSTPIVVYQGVLKLALVAAGMLSCVAFVAALRRRDADRALRGVGRRSLLLVGVATTALFAAGAQAHAQFRSAWTAYPLLTWGAVTVVFASVALVLWLTRLVADRPRRAAAPAVVALLALAVVLNASYELYYVAVPVVLVALARQPVDSPAGPAAARRAKLVTGITFAVGFFALFGWIRWRLARLCAETTCYVGVQPELGLDAVRTAVFNLLSAVPGTAGNELLADLRRVGWEDRFPAPFSHASALVGVAVGALLALVWWLVQRGAPATDPASDPSRRRGEGLLLLFAAALAAAVAVGTAAVMGLSVQAQEIITQPGLPYRSTVVTWAALALTAVLLVRAAGLLLPGRAGTAAWVALCVVVGVTGAYTLPGNLLALRANRVSPGLHATDTILWEAVLGDPDPQGDARRCAALADLAATMPAGSTRRSIVRGADATFRHYHGAPFCSAGTQPAGRPEAPGTPGAADPGEI
jgi:hypothetical protein